jgi:hypothetical protein
VFTGIPATATDAWTQVTFINKRIPRTQLNLFNPTSIVGKGLVIASPDVAEIFFTMCGEIILT